jgi:hypothetical protein
MDIIVATHITTLLRFQYLNPSFAYVWIMLLSLFYRIELIFVNPLVLPPGKLICYSSPYDIKFPKNCPKDQNRKLDKFEHIIQDGHCARKDWNSRGSRGKVEERLRFAPDADVQRRNYPHNHYITILMLISRPNISLDYVYVELL